MQIKEKMYHINLSKNDIKGAKYAILPGDPGRVGSIAKYFPSQSLSEDRTIHHTKSIVVTKNGDRELEISNLFLCDTQETQGNVQNLFYRMFDSFDN